MGGVEYQVTKVDPTDPHTKGAVYQVHKVSEEVAATLGGKVYRARIIKDPTAPTVAGKVYQIVLIGDPSDPAVKGKVYNAILTGGSEAVVVGPAVSPLALPDAVAGDLDYVKAYGGTGQNGTPTPDTPVDIVSNNGAIKFSLNEANYTADNVTLGYWLRNNNGQPEASPANFYTAMIPVKPNTSYVCFGRTKDTNVISGYNRIAWYDADGVWIRNSTYTANTPGIDTSPANAAFARFHCNPNGTEVTQELVDSYNWVFQVGTAEVPYVPYVEGGLYTDGAQETIAIIGPNIFDKTNYEEINAYVNANSGVLTQGSPGATTQYCAVIPCKPNTTYKITGRATSAWGAFTTKTIGTTATTYDKETGVVTTGANDLYLIGLVRANDDAIDYRNTLSVNEVVSTATAEMLLKVGDYTDVQEIPSGAVTRNVGVMVLDGTEGWQLATATDLVQFYTPSTQGVIANSVSLTSTIAPYGCTATNRTQYDFGCYSGGSGNLCFQMKGSATLTTVSAWTQYLAQQYNAGTPVIVIYPLATATTESVAGQTLQVTDGDNTLEITQASIDGLELEAEYEKEAE